jgi:hypothetical protein
VLVAAGGLFTGAVLLHGADHLRRGVDAIDRDVLWAGTAAALVEVAVVVLVCGRHRTAPLAAAVTGLSLAAGYVVVHFLPSRGWLSDALASAPDVTALSWTAASVEVVAGLALGIAGLVVLRNRGGIASAAAGDGTERSLHAGVSHPVAASMLVGNAVILAISFVQL